MAGNAFVNSASNMTKSNIKIMITSLSIKETLFKLTGTKTYKTKL